MAKQLITQEALKRLLDYDPATGIFTWKPRTPDQFENGGHTAEHICARWNTSYAGKQAGTVHPTGYVTINVIGRLYYAHRLAWFYVYGVWPKVTDHINGVRGDNWISNLRSVTTAENHRNQCRRSTNTSGVVGVSFIKERRKWQVRIVVNGTQIELGHFKDFGEAVAARKAAEKDYKFHPNHGNRVFNPEYINT